MNLTKRAVAIMGATATGKSDIAIRLAEEFDGEIISMDSRQVYRGFDIGTGKVTPGDRGRIPHHLIDTLDPHETNSAGAHAAGAEKVLGQILTRRKTAFFVGGTGLYFRVLFRGIIDVSIPEDELRRSRQTLAAQSTALLYDNLREIDPERAAALSPRDRVRIRRAIEIRLLTGKTHSEHIARQKRGAAWGGLKIVLTLPRAALRKRIAERTREMYRKGWVDEVRSLLARGAGLDAPAMKSLGYDIIARAIVEDKDPDATVETVITLTQQYAKRQETFCRSEPDAHWIDVSTSGTDETVRRLVRTHFGL